MQGVNYPPEGSPEPNPFLPKPNKSRSILWEILIIVGLILMLLIPLNMIGGVISERQNTRKEAIQSIISNNGGSQVITGPILAIPYKVITITEETNGKKKTFESKNTAYLFPRNYKVFNNFTEPQLRSQGIFQLLVYSTTLFMNGDFDLKPLAKLHIPNDRFLWNQAYVVLGISDSQGILPNSKIKWQGQSIQFQPGVNGSTLISSGLYALPKIQLDQDIYSFNIDLPIRGSEALNLIPLGESSQFELKPKWHSVNFTGGPEYNVTKNGYEAKWSISSLNRDYGQAVLDTGVIKDQMLKSAVGMQLLNPVDSYRQTERAIKYSILFLVLTFSTYFILEMIGRQRLHPFQYLLVGLALSLFYLLLVAISEVSQFPIAYGVASFAVISMITLYSKAILGKIRKHAQFIVGGLLTALYSYLYTLLQLEDLSLLFGAIGLFVVLGVIMFVTRNIDWYNEEMT